MQSTLAVYQAREPFYAHDRYDDLASPGQASCNVFFSCNTSKKCQLLTLLHFPLGLAVLTCLIPQKLLKDIHRRSVVLYRVSSEESFPRIMNVGL